MNITIIIHCYYYYYTHTHTYIYTWYGMARCDAMLYDMISYGVVL